MLSTLVFDCTYGGRKRQSDAKSMRHKQILDAAAERPDASITQLASMVPSATADLVQHVLDEHGDPDADDGTDITSTAAAEVQTQPENTENNTTESGPADTFDQPAESDTL
jgi:hypothetical protein